MTAFVPTAEQRKMVRAMSAYGVPRTDICKVIRVGDRTLRKAFREELDKASIEANAKGAETCFRMATSGTVPAATFFWLKARAGWREVNRQEHTGGDGGAIQVQQVEDTRPTIASFLLEFREREQIDGTPGYKTALGTDAGV